MVPSWAQRGFESVNRSFNLCCGVLLARFSCGQRPTVAQDSTGRIRGLFLEVFALANLHS